MTPQTKAINHSVPGQLNTSLGATHAARAGALTSRKKLALSAGLALAVGVAISVFGMTHPFQSTTREAENLSAAGASPRETVHDWALAEGASVPGPLAGYAPVSPETL